MANSAYFLLGSNVGERQRYLSTALRMIGQSVGPIVAISSIYETEPWGFTNQRPFLNQAVNVETTLRPDELLAKLLEIESGFGRERKQKNGPRNIDIDIALYNEEEIESESVTVPHPRLHLRKFALVPLAEIAADVRHPVLQKTISELLYECEDTLNVKRVFTVSPNETAERPNEA